MQMEFNLEERPLSVLIATPAYGGLVSTDYVSSLINTLDWFRQSKIQCHLYTLRNESLIPRGRNACAWYALTHGPAGQPFDKLFFIDADMAWEVDDVKRLIESPHKVVGGTYPVKSYPITLAANALEEDYAIFGRRRDVNELQSLRAQCADVRGEVEMRHIPTGFMMIDTQVLINLMPHVRTYAGENLTDLGGPRVRMWDFFPIGPMKEIADSVYESEDWAFCSLVRDKLGLKVFLNTHVVTKHTGSHIFNAGNV